MEIYPKGIPPPTPPHRGRPQRGRGEGHGVRGGGNPLWCISISDIGYWISFYIQNYSNFASLAKQLHIQVHAAKFSQSGINFRYASIPNSKLR